MHVESAQSIVEQHHVAVAVNSPCQTDALFLPTRESYPAFANLAQVSSRKSFCKESMPNLSPWSAREKRKEKEERTNINVESANAKHFLVSILFV